MAELILASASEGRRELFTQSFGQNFLISPVDIGEELYYHLPIEEMVLTLALKKAEACQALRPEGAIFAFDTMVECQGKILGKPADAAEAGAMLLGLRGKVQAVWTGYAFFYKTRRESGARCARLVLEMSPEEIFAYTARHPVTKYAGAYAVQKSDTRIRLLDGSFDTVVGACMDEALAFANSLHF